MGGRFVSAARSPSEFLVHIDVDRIQRYVLASPRLRDIRSASAALDEVTGEEKVRQLLQGEGEVVRASGGSIYAIVRSEEAGRRLVDRLQRDLWGIGASASAALLPMEDGDFAAAQRRVNTLVRRQKDAGPLTAEPSLGCSFLEPCSTCGQRPAASIERIGTEQRDLCVVCAARSRAVRTRHPLFAEIRGIEAWREADPCADLTELAALGGTRYLALVHADGNQMGEALQQLLKGAGSDAKAAYRRFSREIDRAVSAAVAAALQEVWPKGPPGGSAPRIPCEPAIYGGDDLALLIPAPGAFHFAITLLKEFTRNTKASLQTPISMSGGVVISQETFPVVALNRLGNELEDEAKVLHRSRNDRAATLDFLVVTQPSADPVAVQRRRQVAVDRARLYARPYTVTEIETLIRVSRQLRDEGFPEGRLLELYQYTHRGVAESDLWYRQALGRMNPKHRAVLESALTSLGAAPLSLWRPERQGELRSTPLADLVEIHPFSLLPGEKPRGRAAELWWEEA